ncbi:DUF1444 domain-containing protein [Bacillus sp. 1P06AnD]|uniref:DUF1444 domain-containing protein n=1 Tax=Bacillus sp. 1P06AnD TaxID=3132208 RepID=UPI0039A2CEDD
MKLTSKKLKELLCARLEHEDRTFIYDKEKETLRIENSKSKKGINVSLSSLLAKAELNLDGALNETVYYVTEALQAMGNGQSLNGHEKRVYPVIRSTSFPQQDQDGKTFIMEDHTAETRIYYALDLGNTYRLIDEEMLGKSGWTLGALREVAMDNLLMLSTDVKKDSVAGNDFYFLSTKDGYDASKILNVKWLEDMESQMKGNMTVAVPHGDVCIIADVQNDTGYDVLAQMCMSFFASGHIPITALSFSYEDGDLEPIFILGKNKSRK